MVRGGLLSHRACLDEPNEKMNAPVVGWGPSSPLGGSLGGPSFSTELNEGTNGPHGGKMQAAMVGWGSFLSH